MHPIQLFGDLFRLIYEQEIRFLKCMYFIDEEFIQKCD